MPKSQFFFGFAALQITQSYILWAEYASAKFNKMHQRGHKV